MVAISKGAKLISLVDSSIKSERPSSSLKALTEGTGQKDFSFDLPMTEWLGLHDTLRSVATERNIQCDVCCLKDLMFREPAAAQKLLDNLYPIYEKIFSDPKQRTEKSEIQSVLSDYRGARDILIFRDGDTVVGALHFTAFNTNAGKAAAVEYFWMNPEAKDNHSGKQLLRTFEELMERRGVNRIIAEINDPFHMTKEQIEEDRRTSMDPYVRLKVWHRFGLQTIDALYKQAPVGGQTESCNYLRACIRHQGDFKGEEFIHRQDYLELLEGYFRTFSKYSQYKPILESLSWALRDQEYIPLIRMIDERSNQWSRMKA